MKVNQRNSITELSYDKIDPLLVASRYDDEFYYSFCALFCLWKCKINSKILDSLDFSLLEKSDEIIDKELIITIIDFKMPKI